MILKPPGGVWRRNNEVKDFLKKTLERDFFFAQTQNDKNNESVSLRIYVKKCIGNVVNRTEEVSEYDREI